MILNVKSPILGFEDVRSVEITELENGFFKLTSKERDANKEPVSFTIIDPYVVRPDYDFELPTPYQVLMDINNDSQLRVFNMVMLSRTIEESGVNFLAPLVCNMNNNTISQVVLDPKFYPEYSQTEKIGTLVNKNLFTVKGPILGFEDITKVEITPLDKFFVTMKSVESGAEHKNTSFTLINPYVLRSDYSFDVPTPYQVLLDINDRSALRVYNMVMLGKTIGESGVNFIAPIVCNVKNNTMAQIVLDPKDYVEYSQAEKISNFLS